jgi:hypothetical protein
MAEPSRCHGGGAELAAAMEGIVRGSPQIDHPLQLCEQVGQHADRGVELVEETVAGWFA